jgi:hypothetical protein
MKRAVPVVVLVGVALAGAARADEPTNPFAASSPPGAPITIGTAAAPGQAPAAGSPGARSLALEESVVGRAREMLLRARFLDEAATNDERVATDIAARLPTLRVAAKGARDRADKAASAEKEGLVARAEDLEAELAVSEAELAMKRRAAAEDRRVARELRVRAVRLVREGQDEAVSSCDPPFRFTADGRKIYRVECLR